MDTAKTDEKPARDSILKTIWKKIEARRPLFHKNYTYISEGMNFRGDLSSAQNVVIDGTITGNIHSAQHVSIGATARLEGSIESETALVHGYVKGNIRTTKTIVVRIPATIVGDLSSPSVKVQRGVTIHGHIFSGRSNVQVKPAKPLTTSEIKP